MKKVCISLILTIALSSSSLTQTNTAHTTYPANTLSNGISLRAVANAPFSADIVSQSTLTLADGTPVTQETHGKMFRDSAGRTRSETELQSSGAGAARRIVTIVDPVQGTSMVLDMTAQERYSLPSACGKRRQSESGGRCARWTDER